MSQPHFSSVAASLFLICSWAVTGGQSQAPVELCPITGSRQVYRYAWNVDLPSTKGIPTETTLRSENPCTCAGLCQGRLSLCNWWGFDEVTKDCFLRILAPSNRGYHTIFSLAPDHVVVGDLPGPDVNKYFAHYQDKRTSTECMSACQTEPRCFYATWNETDCWLKPAVYTPRRFATGVLSLSGLFPNVPSATTSVVGTVAATRSPTASSTVASPTPTTNSNENQIAGSSSSSSSSAAAPGLIAGMVVGLVLVLASAVAVLVCWKRRKGSWGGSGGGGDKGDALTFADVFPDPDTPRQQLPAAPPLGHSPVESFQNLEHHHLQQMMLPSFHPEMHQDTYYQPPVAAFRNQTYRDAPSPSPSLAYYSEAYPDTYRHAAAPSPVPSATAVPPIPAPPTRAPPLAPPSIALELERTATTTLPPSYDDNDPRASVATFTEYYGIRDQLPVSTDDLQLKAGDAVLVQHYLDDGLCIAVNATRGGKGLVPMRFLKPGRVEKE
ncbi:hypothetical protein DFJ77DRAFT_478834 [Powellomyces hirtus]|nr:hypothetical protein DFJ77DRAFT_478834 [Powellomyces hirtus]